MSEYQYYEFRTIDRPLSEKDRVKLQRVSSRAKVTMASWTNEYTYGDFKGDAGTWMEKYFDASLHFTNWGTREFRLRLPQSTLGLKAAQEFASGDEQGLFVHESGENAILTFRVSEEGGEDWDDGSEALSTLITLRQEIARGDLRALYLGWLCAVETYSVPHESLEPAVPAGLGMLTPALKMLAEMLFLPDSLIEFAAEKSGELTPSTTGPAAIRKWLAHVATEKKDAWLARVFQDDSLVVSTEMRHLFAKNDITAPGPVPKVARRTAEALREGAESRRKSRTKPNRK